MANDGGTLEVILRPERASSIVGEPLELRVTATNAGERGAALLLWNTPFEPTLSADAFEVERDGVVRRILRGNTMP